MSCYASLLGYRLHSPNGREATGGHYRKTDYMITLQEALDYLKGKTIVDLQVKSESDFYYHEFDPERVKIIREEFEKKDKALKTNTLDEHQDTIWVGQCVEEAFDKYFQSEDSGFLAKVGNYKWWTTPYARDSRDFTALKLEMDSKGKTSYKNYRMRLDYVGEMSAKQWHKKFEDPETEKLYGDCPVNVLLFGRFIIPINTAILLGWTTVKMFKSKKKLFGKNNSRLAQDGEVSSYKYTSNTKAFEIPISEMFALKYLRYYAVKGVSQ